MSFSAVIIEDEAPARTTLKSYLAKYFPQVSVAREIETVHESIAYLNQSDVDIVFLDVQLRDGKGIEILNKIKSSRYKIIFTTAYEDYTLDAFRHKSFGYLLKPLDPEDFKEIVGRVLKDLMIVDNSSRKIKIPVKTSEIWVELNDIIRCESESNYAKLYIRKQLNPVLISKTLKYVEEEIIHSPDFVRIHQSHLINISYVRDGIIKANTIELMNGDVIPVSRARKDHLVDLLKKISFS